jgi:xylulokinase
MNDRLLIGVDIGTQGTKAALFTESGTCLSTAFRPSKLHRPDAKTVEEDPDHQLSAVCSSIRSCIKQARVGSSSIKAISIDGQMAGFIGLDANGKPVTPYDSWLDTRCARYIDIMAKKANREILEKAGCAPGFNNGPKMLWWKNERPKAYRNIAVFVTPGGHATMRLCGLNARKAFVDPTYLHFWSFADNQRKCWDRNLVIAFNIDETKLPSIVESNSIVGEIIPSMAKRCSLLAGTPVVAGCGDTSASFLACGAVHEGICVDVAGTASVFATTTSAFKADIKHMTMACSKAVAPGLWHAYAYLSGGMNLEWFRKEIAGGSKGFVELDRLASQVPLTDDLPLFIPHMSGRISPSWPHMRGAWANLSLTASMASLYRAVLEGVALEYGIYRNTLRSLFPKLRLKELRVTGGGASSMIWNQMKANTLNLRVACLTKNEGAPLGSALLAGWGVGLFKDLGQTASQWIKPGKSVNPQKSDVAFYTRRLEQYVNLLEKLNSWKK